MNVFFQFYEEFVIRDLPNFLVSVIHGTCAVNIVNVAVCFYHQSLASSSANTSSMAGRITPQHVLELQAEFDELVKPGIRQIPYNKL
jgi:hypothetical protein